MKTELQSFMERPKLYANVNGTGEMSLGVMMLGFALLGSLMTYLRGVLPESWSGKHDPVGLLVLFGGLVAMLYFIKWGNQAIKQRITWPRTGYVAYRNDKKSRWIVFLVGAVLGAGIGCLMAFARRHDAMSVARMGYLAILPAAYAISIYRFGREYPWKWVVVLFLALGLVVIGLIAPGDLDALFQPVALFAGLVWLVSGAITLILYLLHTQPPTPAAE